MINIRYVKLNEGEDQRNEMDITGRIVDIKEIHPRRKASIDWEKIRNTCLKLKPNKGYLIPVPKGTKQAQFAWQVRSAFKKTSKKFHIAVTKDGSIAISKKMHGELS